MAELKEDMLVSKDKIKVKRTTEEYELAKSDLVPDTGEEAPTWYNKTAGLLDKFRVIPRLVMLAYIFAFYTSVKWFMGLTVIILEKQYLKGVLNQLKLLFQLIQESLK